MLKTLLQIIDLVGHDDAAFPAEIELQANFCYRERTGLGEQPLNPDRRDYKALTRMVNSNSYPRLRVPTQQLVYCQIFQVFRHA